MPDAGTSVLIVTPNGEDAALAVSFLAEAGVAAEACADLVELRERLAPGIGCVVLADEALGEDLAPLLEALAAQPPWSDLPLILVARQGAALRALAESTFAESGNLTLLERPLNPLTLVSGVRVALRARSRQLEVRDLLAQREEALRQRDEFLAMLAHELRNPLAPMRNAAYIQARLGIDDPRFAKTREIFERQIAHLSRLVDDLLDVARLERGKVELRLRRVDLNAVVSAAVDAGLAGLQARGHRVSIGLSPAPLPLDADPVRIEQLVTNLLANAAKFTPEGGEVEIRTAAEEGLATVSVRDTGVGIEPEQLERIFSLFAQADHSLARTGGGLGIGLTLSRRLAELHGGRLEAHSEGPGKGATFVARFPLAGAPAGHAPERGDAGVPSGARRVLVVEDNPDIRDSLRMMLRLWGHEVLSAGTGPEGLELAMRERPDVALIDIGLPGLSGYDLARRLRAERDGMKLVAVTGYGRAADRKAALAAGFDVHLLKPIDPHRLREVLAG